MKEEHKRKGKIEASQKGKGIEKKEGRIGMGQKKKKGNGIFTLNLAGQTELSLVEMDGSQALGGKVPQGGLDAWVEVAGGGEKGVEDGADWAQVEVKGEWRKRR